MHRTAGPRGAAGTADAADIKSASPTSAPGPGDDRGRKLARDIQRELKRVGCYSGDIDGVWSPSTRRAMSAFTERVNASLPVEAPDFILLTLVQGHADRACGRGCPAGQGAGPDGHCVPTALLARSARRASPSPSRSEARIEAPAPSRTAIAAAPSPAPPAAVAEPRTPAPPPLAGRMTVGGPTAADELRVTSVPPRPSAPVASAPAHRDPWSAAVSVTPPVAVYTPPASRSASPKAGRDDFTAAIAPKAPSATSAEDTPPRLPSRPPGHPIARYVPPGAASPAPVVRPSAVRTRSAASASSFRRPTGALFHQLTRNSP